MSSRVVAVKDAVAARGPLLALTSLVALLAAPPAATAGETAAESPPEVAAAASPEQQRRARLEQAWSQMQRVVARLPAIRDFVATFHMQEYKGELRPRERVLIKWRRAPRSVYMKWTGGRFPGQESLWVQGWNDGKLRGHRGSFPDVTLDLDPHGRLAAGDRRYPITEAGFDRIVQQIARALKLAIDDPTIDLDVKALGEQTVYGAKSLCFDSTMNKAKHSQLYAHRALICMHAELLVPTRVQVWDVEDGALRMVEDYGYEAIRLNVGLGDRDFDPENPEYDF